MFSKIEKLQHCKKKSKKFKPQKNCNIDQNLDTGRHFHVNNVLCGRGHVAFNNKGNTYFRGLVKSFKIDYICGTKQQKKEYSQILYSKIRQLDPPGRFLKYDPKSCTWKDIGRKKSLLKIKQALREGAPYLRQTFTSEMLHKSAEILNSTQSTHKEANLKESSTSILEVGSTDSTCFPDVLPALLNKTPQIELRALYMNDKFDSSHNVTNQEFENVYTDLNALSGQRIHPTRYF